MTEKVTIPSDLRDRLAGANGDPVPLYDPAGAVVGYYVSRARMDAIRAERTSTYATAGQLASEDELDEAERAGGAHTMDEVLKLSTKR